MVGDGKRCAGLSAEGPNGRKIVDNQPDYTEMRNTDWKRVEILQLSQKLHGGSDREEVK